ncbi:hypothetical protein MRB53_030851 [Persea americana]|uniref:Uncharacterized protein n=1 Tax=Persea americana TaxID=3435 RepID=A0ACC2KNF2_PERAE|nr:hypothetical protein MRB53_030851 [Persea americana]
MAEVSSPKLKLRISERSKPTPSSLSERRTWKRSLVSLDLALCFFESLLVDCRHGSNSIEFTCEKWPTQLKSIFPKALCYRSGSVQSD